MALGLDFLLSGFDLPQGGVIPLVRRLAIVIEGIDQSVGLRPGGKKLAYVKKGVLFENVFCKTKHSQRGTPGWHSLLQWMRRGQ
jgi:hypothetical protein